MPQSPDDISAQQNSAETLSKRIVKSIFKERPEKLVEELTDLVQVLTAKVLFDTFSIPPKKILSEKTLSSKITEDLLATRPPKLEAKLTALVDSFVADFKVLTTKGLGEPAKSAEALSATLVQGSTVKKTETKTSAVKAPKKPLSTKEGTKTKFPPIEETLLTDWLSLLPHTADRRVILEDLAEHAQITPLNVLILDEKRFLKVDTRAFDDRGEKAAAFIKILEDALEAKGVPVRKPLTMPQEIMWRRLRTGADL